MVSIHAEGADGLEDECEHKSALPAVGASHGVGADAAEADAVAATSNAAGADAATAAFSRSAGSTEVVRGSFSVEDPRREGQTQMLISVHQIWPCEVKMPMRASSANNEHTQKHSVLTHLRGD